MIQQQGSCGIRNSIYIPGFAHKNPVPAACCKGGFVVSGGISGLDVETGVMPPTLDEQCRNIFRHFSAVMTAAGGSVADIVIVTVWLVEFEYAQRDALNREWLAMFPDPAHRPARHVHKADFGNGVLIVCELTAVLDA